MREAAIFRNYFGLEIPRDPRACPHDVAVMGRHTMSREPPGRPRT
jgi:hypothetical protein